MVYQIVLKDGEVLNCWTENIENVVEMMFKHDLYVVQESKYPDKVTYLLPEMVSHYRFPKDEKGVLKPV